MSGPEDTVTGREAYSGGHYARAFPQGYAGHFWHQARLRVVLSRLTQAPVRSVIDIGCGPGAYVQALRDRGYDALGCDPGEVQAADALMPYVFPRTEVDALDPARLARVEVALLLDVLEHLSDPAALLRRVAAALPALRLVIVTVPARAELWSELDRHAGHHRRFHLDDLTAVVEGAGFVVTEATYLFRLLYPAAWLLKRRARRRAVSTPLHPGWHQGLGHVLAAEQHLLPPWLPGTSALCVAHPRTSAHGRPA